MPYPASNASAPPRSTPIARLLRFLAPEGRDIAVVVVYAVGVGLLSLTTPIAVQALVNTVAFGTLVQPLTVLALLLLAGLSFAALLRGLQAWVVELLQRRLFIRASSALSWRLPRVGATELGGQHGPELANRFFDLFTVQKSAAALLIGGLEVALSAFAGMLILAFYHPMLLAFDIVLLGALVLIMLVLGRGAVGSSLSESSAKYRLAAWFEELLSRPGRFASGAGLALSWERGDALARDWLEARRQHFRILFRQIVGALMLQAVASAALLGVGGWLVMQGQLTLGQLVAAELIVTAVVASFAKLGKQLESWYDLLAGMDKLARLLELHVRRADGDERPEGDGPMHVTLPAAGLEMLPGSRVALAGDPVARHRLVAEIGARTEPRAERVRYNGVDRVDLAPEALADAVHLVREPALFSGTLRENLSLGREDITRGTVRRTLAAAGLDQLLESLPDGLDTELGAEGAPLPPTTRLQLTLVRALCLRPRLMVIDESLDHLPEESRRRFFDLLAAADAPWTLILNTELGELRARCDGSALLPAGPDTTSETEETCA